MTGVFSIGMVNGNPLGWIWTVFFFFDGIPYEYSYAVGGRLTTPKEAEDHIRRQGLHLLAQREFLRDVHLDKERMN